MRARLVGWLLRRVFPQGVHIVFVADGVVSVIRAERPVITVQSGPSIFTATMGAGLDGPGIPYAPPWIVDVQVSIP